MTKLKNPLLSMDARGSLGDSVTFTRRHKTNIVEKLPLPAYRNTLPQQYQRWLYEDYAYLWTQQSNATKMSYRKLGYPYHLTGFQSWMKYNLTHLPDITGLWHLDTNLGGLTPDSSRNENPGTVVGTTLVPGLIDHALDFDGLNDYVRLPQPSLYNLPSSFTVEVFAYVRTAVQFDTPLSKGWVTPFPFRLEFNAAPRLSFIINDGVAGPSATLTTDIRGDWFCIHAIRHVSDDRLYLFQNAILEGNVADTTTLATGNTSPLMFGARHPTANFTDGILDHIVIYNRVLDSTERQRHSERRFLL